MAYVPEMLKKYREQVIPDLQKEFGYKNLMQVPRLRKVTLNMGLGEAVASASALEQGVAQLTVIAGQKPVVTKAKKSIANFKLREGMSIGAMVTLRHTAMWDFFSRLVNVALPRVRDFRGLSSKAFDGRGNYSIGIRDHVIFPEIDVDTIDHSRGLGVVVNTTASSDEEGRSLLRLLGVPFRES